MPSHHDDINLVAGDDWVIPGTLLDANGNALDLTSASFNWVLVDPNGEVVNTLVSASTLTPQQPLTAGQIQISVPRANTEALLAGRYHDSLRVIDANQVSSYWVGTILVDGDPFSLSYESP